MLDGFITGRIVHNGLKITSIAVFPHARRLGLATKLFNSLVADAGNRNAFNKPSSEKLISTVIHEENNAAIEFFCKLGFKAKSVEQGCFYSDSRDGYLMTRKKDL
jgi:ribosomal protein S18 acetylase RimI-like enzyme